MGTAILLELVRTFSSMVSNGKARAWARARRRQDGAEGQLGAQAGGWPLRPGLQTGSLMSYLRGPSITACPFPHLNMKVLLLRGLSEG